MFALGVLIGIAFVLLMAVLFKWVFRSILIRRLTGKDAPLLAWRIMSERQLDMLLRESLQTMPITPSRSDVRKAVSVLREMRAPHIRNFEAMDAIDEISAFMVDHGLPHFRPEQIASANPKNHILTSDRPGEYHPFTPPRGPIRFPAEFEPVSAVLLTWPTQYPIRWVRHAALAAGISKVAEAHIVVPNASWAAATMAFLVDADANFTNIRFICAPSDDLWIRDYGPTMVFAGTGPVFIANPYVPNGLGFHRRDNELPVEIARVYGLPVHRLPIVMEGGNLLSDGAGGVFMCSSVFDHNADLDQPELRRIMKAYFGAERLTLLPPMPLENTGHVDIALKFASLTTAWVTQVPGNHPWHETLERVATIVETTHRVERMSIAPLKGGISERCPANALTVNDTIFYPGYDRDADRAAAKSFRALSPDKALVSVDYCDFGVGGLHCQTKEIPKWSIAARL